MNYALMVCAEILLILILMGYNNNIVNFVQKIINKFVQKKDNMNINAKLVIIIKIYVSQDNNVKIINVFFKENHIVIFILINNNLVKYKIICQLIQNVINYLIVLGANLEAFVIQMIINVIIFNKLDVNFVNINLIWYVLLNYMKKNM